MVQSTVRQAAEIESKKNPTKKLGLGNSKKQSMKAVMAKPQVTDYLTLIGDASLTNDNLYRHTSKSFIKTYTRAHTQ